MQGRCGCAGRVGGSECACTSCVRVHLLHNTAFNSFLTSGIQVAALKLQELFGLPHKTCKEQNHVLQQDVHLRIPTPPESQPNWNHPKPKRLGFIISQRFRKHYQVENSLAPHAKSPILTSGQASGFGNSQLQFGAWESAQT